jgi:hypothetical protein
VVIFKVIHVFLVIVIKVTSVLQVHLNYNLVTSRQGTSVQKVVDADELGSYKSNYHTITTTTVPKSDGFIHFVFPYNILMLTCSWKSNYYTISAMMAPMQLIEVEQAKTSGNF